MKTALIIYYSSTGNTEKAAQAIRMGFEEAGVQVTMKKPQEAVDLDYFNYDLVCIGFFIHRMAPRQSDLRFT